jgi:hypothetical protein
MTPCGSCVHLVSVQESHSNLVTLGEEWQREQALAEARQRRQAASEALAAAAFASSSKKQSGTISMLSLSGGASSNSRAAPMKAINLLPFDLAAFLNPTAAAAANKANMGLKQPPPVDPVQEALKPAGSHPGLVPLLFCYVGMMRTGHQLLELRGASGIARMCFAAAMGSPSAAQLLMETKATAAAAGAIGALVDLLRYQHGLAGSANDILVIGVALSGIATSTLAHNCRIQRVGQVFQKQRLHLVLQVECHKVDSAGRWGHAAPTSQPVAAC